MKKEDLIELGISPEIVNFVLSDERNNRILNQENMALSDKITIVGIADKVSESTIEGKSRKWVDVLTTGDRNTISISRLVGTTKRVKYFNAKRDGETEDGEPLFEALPNWESRKLLTLPNREGDALNEIAQNHINKQYEVVAIARGCGQYSQTFYLFAEV